MAAKPRITVVLPIYRTAQYLRELHRRLIATLTPLAGDFELILIDDGSPDEAWTIVRELAQSDPRVKAIRLSRNFGQHAAICAGFEHAHGELIVLMDADLQDCPEDIPVLMKHLQDDCDVVYTTKEEAGEPLLTRWTSRLYHAAFARFTGQAVPRNIGTFRLFTRRMLEALRAYPEYNILYGPLMFHVGFRWTVAPVSHPRRPGGGSSYTFWKRLKLAVSSLISYTDFPHRFLVGFGGLILILSVLYSIALVVRYATTAGQLPPGLTLLALLITLSLGSLMMGLGIIGMYVFRVYQEVLRRPRYIKARTLNLDEE